MNVNDDNLVCLLSVKDEPPWVDGTKFLCNGRVVDYEDNSKECFSPISKSRDEKRTPIGSVMQMSEPMIGEALRNARSAWNGGNGVWPKASHSDRITAVQNVLNALQLRRDEIIRIILWDACKTLKEANLEFNQAMKFAEGALRDFNNLSRESRTVPIGTVLCWGAEVNSFVETYRMLIPALVTGNILIVKVPCVGGLVHILTMEAFTRNLPPNTVQFVVGPINVVSNALMNTGEVDMLALAGARSFADQLIHAHANPHRLKLQLHLESETLAVVLSNADLSLAANAITSAVQSSRNHSSGLKLVLVHVSVIQSFLQELCAAMRRLKCGLPWTKGVDITPVPGTNNSPKMLQELLIDALRKGAMVVNSEDGGGHLLPEFHGTIMKPAVVYPVNSTMQLWDVKVKGPIVAVASYTHMDEICAHVSAGGAELQACVFTTDPEHGDFQTLLEELPYEVSAVAVNEISTEQHVVGYGTLASGLGCGQAGWCTTEALKAFTTEPVHVDRPHRINTSLECVPAASGAGVAGKAEPEAEAENSERERCLAHGSFTSPIGIADLRTSSKELEEADC